MSAEEKLASPRSLLLAALGLGVLGGLLPILLAIAALGGVRSLRPAGAIALLDDNRGQAALVDVRPGADFAVRHVQASVSLPLAELLDLRSLDELPAVLQGKTLVLICAAGFDSARAARHLAGLGIGVAHVRGGLQEWGRDGPRLDPSGTGQSARTSSYAQIVDSSGQVISTYRPSSQAEQAAAAAGLLFIKPIYMLLSMALLYPLLRSPALDLRLAGWGVLLFWLGEAACAVHYTLLKDDSFLAEFLHSYGMVLAFGVTAYALLELLDRRLLHFSAPEKRCAFVELCGPCIKHPAGGLPVTHCGLRRLARLLLPVGALLALIPLFAPLSLVSYNTHIGPVVHFYTRTAIQQLFEVRFSPLAAVLLFGLSWLALELTPRSPIHPLARLLASAAFGFLGFSYFRAGLGLIYAQNLALATFWEEATELVFILAGLYLLWIFRHSLLRGVRLPAWVDV